MTGSPDQVDKFTRKIYSLADLTEMALRDGPQVEYARYSTYVRSAEVGVAQAAYYPRISASASVGRLNRRIQVDDPYTESRLRTRTEQMQASLSWVLYDFGLRSAAVEASKQALNAALSAQHYSYTATSIEVGNKFFHACEFQEAEEVYRIAEDAARRSLLISTTHFKAGVGQYSNKLLAESNLAQAILNRTTAEGQKNIALADLAAYVGFRGGERLRIHFRDETDSTTDALLETVDATLTARMERHPRVLQAIANLKLAEAEVVMATAEGRPKLSIVVTNARSKTLPTDYARQTTDSTSATLQLQIPIFEGFSRSGKIQIAAATVAAKRAELERVRREIDSLLWVSYEKLTAELKRLRLASSLMRHAGTSLAVSQERFKAGVGDIFEILRSEADLLAASQQAVSARSGARRAKLELLLNLH